MTDNTYGPETTSDELIEGMDLSGRRVLVTKENKELTMEILRPDRLEAAAKTLADATE